jgi:solute carrier family 25 carnitine/acylcarnitine transporter 20/29
VKSRVQRGIFPSMSTCVTETFHKEGVRGFYRGVTPPLFLSGLTNSILFSINQAMTNLVTPADHDKSKPLPLHRTAFAGQLTAPLYVACLTPMEVVKVKLQVQDPTKRLFSGPLDCIVKIVRNDGVLALQRGYLPTVGSRIVGLPFYFSGYQVAKEFLAPSGSTPPGTKLPLYVPMLSGVVAGLWFWCSNYPLDFIKTQAQAMDGKKISLVDIARSTYRKGGIRAFYVGFAPCMLRSIPANATVWIGIEYTTTFLASRGF